MILQDCERKITSPVLGEWRLRFTIGERETYLAWQALLNLRFNLLKVECNGDRRIYGTDF